MNLVGKIIHGMNKGQLTKALFLDLSKAFDTSNHNILVKKLDRYGIRGVTKYWLINYLSNRKIRCKIQHGSKEHKSDYYDMSIGTPQGSCLGPLLFLIFVNDLQLNVIKSDCILFADDTTLYKTGPKLNDVGETYRLVLLYYQTGLKQTFYH